MPVDAGQHIGLRTAPGSAKSTVRPSRASRSALAPKIEWRPGSTPGANSTRKSAALWAGSKSLARAAEPKNLQLPNAVALADGGDARAVLGDGGVHWAVSINQALVLALSGKGCSLRLRKYCCGLSCSTLPFSSTTM